MGNREVYGDFERRVWNKTRDTRIKTVKHLIVFLNWWYFQVCRLPLPGWDLTPVPLGGTSPFLRWGITGEARFGDGRFICQLYCTGNCICSKDHKLLEKWILSLKFPQISPGVESRCLMNNLWIYYPQWFLRIELKGEPWWWSLCLPSPDPLESGAGTGGEGTWRR